MSAVRVLLPPAAASLAHAVSAAGCTPVIDAASCPALDASTPTVPSGAWVRTRPGRPAPGTGPVILVEHGSPIQDRETWLETSTPREIPEGFAGLILKGREAGGLCGDIDGLLALADTPDPSRVILEAGLGPRGAGAAAALGAAGVLLDGQHLAMPELSLPDRLRARLQLPAEEITCVIRGHRVANPPTAPVVRALLRGEDPWSLTSGLWETADLQTSLWLVGQGAALAVSLAERYGTLATLLRAYVSAWNDWPVRARSAYAAQAPLETSPDVLATGAATTGGLLGSGPLFEIAAWMDRPVSPTPLRAALAFGTGVVCPEPQLRAEVETWLGPVQEEPAPPPVTASPATGPERPVLHPRDGEAAAAIAIIGIGCVFPDAPNVDAFWNNVVQGHSAIREVPEERWDPALYWSADHPDKSYAKIGGFIRDFTFQSKKFRIPPRVAAKLDPVQKLALTAVDEAFADAGLKRSAKAEGRAFDRERCAVILGNSLGGEITGAYAQRLAWPEIRKLLADVPAIAALPVHERDALLESMEGTYKADLPAIDEDSMPGELANVIAGRIANAFDLQGANFTVDAACASSMAAVQAAVKGLQDGDFDLAITGGADRSMDVPTYVKFCRIGALSPDHSAPFDASANGFVMGEGAGILILKRYEDAVRDSDKIYAVIRGIGASSDGRGKGITAPNKIGQVLALQRAYASAGLNPADVDLVECHGTSTVVGDRVELEALSDAIGDARPTERGPVRIGSVKSMIGHLKSAAGAASCIKAALALHHRTLPPSINVQQVRSDLPLDRVPLLVQTTAEAWPAPPDGLRRCGISAFGFGGTNFHVVMEAYADQPLPRSAPQEPPPPQQPSTAPVPSTATPAEPPRQEALPEGLWATSASDLPTLLQHLRKLRDGDSVPWHPSAPFRIAAAASSVEERNGQVERALKVLEKGTNADMLRARGIYYEDRPFDGKLAFVFTGQGSQYLDMGLDLAEAYPIVAETFAEADAILTPILGQPLTELIRSTGDKDAKAAMLKRTEYSQPATLTLDVALLRLVASFGLSPDVVAGHSLGEYGACVAAGIMTFEQALHAVSARGREMAGIRLDDPGKMAGIATQADVVEEVLAEVDGYVVAANKNCPTQTVIAGASDAVEEAIERFRARGITVHPLPVSHAFHSQIVAPATEPLRAVLSRLDLAVPQRPITTNVTAAYYPADTTAIIDLLARQVASPVEWVAQIERMYQDGVRAFLELGPKRALTGFTVSILKRRPHRAFYTNHPKKGGVASFRDGLAGLIAAGFPVRSTPSATPYRPDTSPPSRHATTEAITTWLARQARPDALADLQHSILQIISANTGYDIEEIGVDDELEADLGIDTVKQAEIYAAVRMTWSLEADPDFSFARHRTIRSVVDWAAGRLGATRIAPITPVPASLPAHSTDDAIAQFLQMAAHSGMSGRDAEAFAADVLPAVRALLDIAFKSAQQTRAPVPTPSTAQPKAPPVLPAAPPAILTTPAVTTSAAIVCSGASVGLPGGEEVFAPDNFAAILRGENRISHIGAASDQFLEMNIVRLVKDAQTGQGSFEKVDDLSQTIRLMGQKSKFDATDYGIPERLLGALDITSQLAIAAGLEALRDAGIPLIRRFKKSARGKNVPVGWMLPEPLRDTTGVIFASAFPGYDQMARKLQSNGDDGEGHFDRRFLFQILNMGHAQFAQLIGARGPNTSVNAACASTAQAVTIGEDWIRLGRCDRVVIVGADDVSNETLGKWIGSGFLVAGAATPHDVVEEAALPFDRRRHGMILGMGAVGLVLERQSECEERGVVPIAQLLGSQIANSAFHGTRLDKEHIQNVMRSLIAEVAANEGVSPAGIARKGLFMSHETYTPARGGSAAAEIAALRASFGDAASEIVVTNTKGMTGHAMGAGIEDAVVLKALQYGEVPPVVNLRDPDPELGDLTLSTGGPRELDYAVRFAAGFGSQLAVTIWKRIARGDQRSNPARRARWLKQISGYTGVREAIEDRTLKIFEAPQDALLEIGSLEPAHAPPPQIVAPAPEQAVPAQELVAPVAPSETDGGILSHLIALVAEKTGYEPAEIDPTYELEADLGIDTVKQAEILSEVSEKYGLPVETEIRFSEIPTLEALAAHVHRARGGTEPLPAQRPVATASAVSAPPTVMTSHPSTQSPPRAEVDPEILEALTALIAEKTGYEPAELEPDFELEADLGIDTVKQAEIFSEISERYGIAQDDTFRLAETPTIASLASYIGEAAMEPPTALSTAAAPPSAPATAPQVEETAVLETLTALIAEKTGYEPAELEPDFELEADLGIDTVKQAEIFSEISERYGIIQDDSFRLSEAATIAALSQYIATAASTPPQPTPAAPSDPEPSISTKIVDSGDEQPTLPEIVVALTRLIAEKTGYEPSELEPDFELEADLGIDTVKQAEILSEISEEYGIVQQDGLRLSETPTIEALAGALHQALSAPVAGGERTDPAAPPSKEIAPAAVAAAAPSPPTAPATYAPGSLPDSFRLRRPTLIPRPLALAEIDVVGMGVRVLGEGPCAESVRHGLEALGARVTAPWTIVIDVGDDVMHSFALARELEQARPRMWITLTRLGGFSATPSAHTFGDGARAGFTKALGMEWEECESCVLDVAPSTSPEESVQRIFEELCGRALPHEVFYTETGRHTVSYETCAPPAVGRLVDNPVVLITGGARGISARIAAELARTAPVQLALVGRGPAATSPLDVATAKDQIRAALDAEGIRKTPAEISRRLAPLEKAEEIRQTIETLTALGAVVQYFQADLAVPGAVETLYAEVAEALDEPDVIIHGAGVEESRLVADKNPAAFHRVFDGKALGGKALIAQAPDNAYVLSMGSVAGRFGNPGQVDYAAANDALARLCWKRPGSLHVDWTAWDDVGMAVRGGMRQLLSHRGVDLLPADAGAALAVGLIAAGVEGELVVSGGLGSFFPKPDHPLADEFCYRGDEVELTRTFSLESDPWLTDHAIDGKPVLPGVIGLELMAEAARLATASHVVGARTVRFDTPIKLYGSAPTRVIVTAQPRAGGEVSCIVAAERMLKTGRLQKTVHFSATFTTAAEEPIPALPSAFVPDESIPSEAIYERFFHGPRFQVLTQILGVSADGLVGEASVAHERIAPSLVTQPLLLEAAFQAAGLHQMLITNIMGLPQSIGRVQLLGTVSANEPLSLTVRRGDGVYDIDVDGPTGPLLRVRDFALVDAGPLPENKRFPTPDEERPVCFPQTTLATGSADEAQAVLDEEEIARLSARGTERRVRDRLAGQVAAKRAVARLTGVSPPAVRVVRHSSGEPLAFVPGFPDLFVSISHREGTAVALAGTMRVGVDIEQIADRGVRFVEDWFGPTERPLLTDSVAVTVGWSVKEAVLKIIGRGMAVHPRSVVLRAIGAGSAEVDLHDEAALSWEARGGGKLLISWSLIETEQVVVTVRQAA